MSSLTAPGALYHHHMGPDANVADLFLPERLQLGRCNLLAFKYTMESVLRIRGIPLEHFTHRFCPRLRSCRGPGSDEISRRHEELWRADDEFCKAVLMLNTKPGLVQFHFDSYKRSSFAAVWEDVESAYAEMQARRRRDMLGICVFLISMLWGGIFMWEYLCATPADPGLYLSHPRPIWEYTRRARPEGRCARVWSM